jgi:hypothetical protein
MRTVALPSGKPSTVDTPVLQPSIIRASHR